MIMINNELKLIENKKNESYNSYVVRLKEYDDNNNNEPHYIKIKENTEVEE